MQTPKEEYLNVIRHTQLISLDLIVRNETDEETSSQVARNKILMGRRANKPAQNYWFTFGSRVFKDESLRDACRRVAKTEIGIDVEIDDCCKNGVYIHKYDDNFDNDDFGTTYVVFAFECGVNSADLNIVGDDQHIVGDDQHCEYRWFSIDEIMAREDVHLYVKNYFRNADNRIW